MGNIFIIIDNFRNLFAKKESKHRLLGFDAIKRGPTKEFED